jgi:hydroxyacylglutathione hydrolase
VSIAPSELMERIERGDAPAILDVRSALEFKNGHVPGALHVPFWTIGSHLSEIPAAPDQELIVYCGHGPRAWRAGGVLRRHGFTNVTYLHGHMHAWRQAGLREETGVQK